RKYLSEESTPKILIDLGSGIFESATVDSNILISEKFNTQKCNLVAMDLSKEKEFLGFESYLDESIVISECSEEIWTIASPIEQLIKRKVEVVGVPLKDWDIDINYGVKTGLSDAFIIDKSTKNKLIQNDAKSANLIEPVLRGRDIKRYTVDFQELYIISLFPAKNIDINKYPAIKEHLETFGSRLEQSGEKGSRKKTSNLWFETQDQISYHNTFSNNKLIYPDINSKLSFMYDDNSYFMTNTAYFLDTDSKYILSVLNSSPMQYYFSTISAQLGKSGLRHFTIYIEKLPIPKVEDEVEKEFIDKANSILILNKTLQAKKQKFLKRVSDNFNLDKLSKKLEAFYESDFKTFLAELKKKKTTLTLMQQDEWEEYFEAYQKELLELQTEIDATDKQIDEMVYELYGLSEAEVSVVEGR
ncbi:MAG TPA: N-6 DNA methylase, partial [Sulfurospirillum arcachonense]|nr:N-6 DNA methylase [Sulfurospirillum arcachonense]